jgi:hypothetical protein
LIERFIVSKNEGNEVKDSGIGTMISGRERHGKEHAYEYERI